MAQNAYGRTVTRTVQSTSQLQFQEQIMFDNVVVRVIQVTLTTPPGVALKQWGWLTPIDETINRDTFEQTIHVTLAGVEVGTIHIVCVPDPEIGHAVEMDTAWVADPANPAPASISTEVIA